MSRKTDLHRWRYFYRERNRFSILVSLARSQLTPAEYRSLRRFQTASDHILRRRRLAPRYCRAWVQQLSQELDKAFSLLEWGQSPRLRLHRIVHLYRDLFRVS